jgi:hypothetical protein
VAEQDSSGMVETVALITFFAGFALGVQAERTNIPEPATPVAAVAFATPTEAPASSPLALRGATGLFQLGGAVIP